MSSSSLESQAMALLSAALDQPSNEREAWVRDQAGDNSPLYDRVMALLSADQEHEAVLRTGGAGKESRLPPPPERIGAYKITRLIGQGGMGAVYEGTRLTDNFDLRVAIKIVRPGALSEALTERFERERQILASLNHPHIARLYDGGQLDDGAPYIVMEYVDGEPITDWASQQDLSLGDRLALFADLCSAVQHAHQNLIIHRDITPSNVMVTSDRQVKLIDFGIAKPHATSEDAAASPEANSLTGLSFTPGYAAPERSKGAAANTLSDVYSLGKILEALAEPLKDNADLQAIIRQATASDPANRYPSVDALLEDVQNLRSGRSVDARGGGALYSFGKFVNRHKLAVTAGATAIVFLIGSLATMTHLYNQSETNRLAADQRFEESRDMAKFMMFDLYDELYPISGNTEALQLMADRARSYLDDLSKSSRSDHILELETIQGYHRLANIEGNPISPNLGRRENSQALLELTQQRLVELSSERPDDPGVLRELGQLAFSQSVYAYIAEDDNDKSIALAEKGVEYFDQLSALGAATLDDEIMRFDVMQYTGKPYIWMEESAKAVERYLQIEKELLAFEVENPGVESISYTVATFYTSFTEVSSWDVDFTDADPALMLRVADEAVKRMDALSELENPETDYRRSRALAYYRRASMYGDLERQDESIPDLETARVAAQSLVDDDPRNEGSQTLLAAIESQLMLDLSITERHDEAIQLGEILLEKNRVQFEAESDNPGYWRNYFQKVHMVAETYLAAEQYGRGCDLILEAAQSGRAFDEAIGVSEGDRDHMYDDLLLQEAACRAGTIADLELGED